jgi:hypothetical protein
MLAMTELQAQTELLLSFLHCNHQQVCMGGYKRFAQLSQSRETM